MTPYPLPYASSQSYDKIDSFLKPALNILILCDLILW